MFKPVFDLHTHTISSGHAYSTLLENITAAKQSGLLAYGFSDHAPGPVGLAGPLHFDNFRVIPKEVYGIKILCGAEANISDYAGSIDITEKQARKMDFIIASVHRQCYQNGTVEQNTAALIGAMENPCVAIIGHPDDSRYPVDYDSLAKAAARTGKLLELNNSSLNPHSTRQNAHENAKQMLLKCREYGAKIIMNTDSHICFDIGNFDLSIALLKELDFPKDLIANLSLERLSWVTGVLDRLKLQP